MWVRGVVCHGTQTNALIVVVFVSAYLVFMSVAVFIEIVCQAFNLTVIQIEVCQRSVWSL